MVAARSKALIPVVVPRASTLTVKRVPWGSWFLSTMRGRSRALALSSVRATQRRPRHSLSMKFTHSGVTCSAAIMRSPSFSRSSSSTRITGRPALSSSRSSWTLAIPSITLSPKAAPRTGR